MLLRFLERKLLYERKENDDECEEITEEQKEVDNNIINFVMFLCDS